MKNWKLEFVRGLAAFMVFLCHFIMKNPTLQSKSYLNLIGNWGTESVIIFFILSGIVIHITQTKKPKTTGQFILNRIKRIYPSYIIGMALAFLAYKLTTQNDPAPNFIGNLFFIGTLQSYIISTPATNPVVWSLTFEMFFYFVYAFSIGNHQKKFIGAWFLLSLICIPLYYLRLTGIQGHLIAMFAFSSIWLIGYYICEYQNLIGVKNLKVAIAFAALLPGVSRLILSTEYYDVFKYLLFALVAAPCFWYCLDTAKPGATKTRYTLSIIYPAILTVLLIGGLMLLSNSLLISKMLYIGMPVLALLFAFIPVKPISTNLLQKLSLFFGKISYSLYIVHFPILVMINYYVPNLILYAVLGMTVSISFSWFLETRYQSFILSLFKKKQLASA